MRRSPRIADATFERRLFADNPLPMWVYDLETLRFLAVNNAACAKYGFSRDEFFAMTIRDIRPAEDVPDLKSSLNEPPPLSFDKKVWRHRCKGGSLILVEVSAHDILFEGRRARFIHPHDVTERILLERSLRESERGMERAQRLARLSHVVTGPAGEFESWSRTFASLIGVPDKGVPPTTRQWLELVHPEDRAAFRSMALEARRTGQRGEINYRLWRPDGQWIHVRQSTEPMAESDPRSAGARWFSTLQDVTSQRQAEEEVRRLNLELEGRVEERTRDLQAAVKGLEAFTYMVSHDLRAPLRAIDGFTAILAENLADGLDAENAGYLGRVTRNARQMGRLIDDLLAFARAGRQALRREPLDLVAIVAAKLQIFQEEVANRGIVVDVGEMPPCSGDPGLIAEVFQNLIENAIKYTRGCANSLITIGACTEGGVPAIFVRDNGAGFDMRHAEGLFEVFRRLHSEREFEGTGVGLAIVRQIVERHGGSIRAEARPGKGATFTFTIPGR